MTKHFTLTSSSGTFFITSSSGLTRGSIPYYLFGFSEQVREWHLKCVRKWQRKSVQEYPHIKNSFLIYTFSNSVSLLHTKQNPLSKAGGCSKTVTKLNKKTARLIQHIALFTDIRPIEQKSAYTILSRLCSKATIQFSKRVFYALGKQLSALF